MERITERGVVVDGEEYEVDCLIFATGFEVGTAYTRRAGFDIVGRDGLTLGQKWDEQVASFHGLMSRGFPNCFFMGGGAVGGLAELHRALQRAELSTSPTWSRAWRRRTPAPSSRPRRPRPTGCARSSTSAAGREAFYESCTPGYYNNEGKPGEGPGWFGGNYGGSAPEFFRLLRDWRDAGALEGLELT